MKRLIVPAISILILIFVMTSGCQNQNVPNTVSDNTEVNDDAGQTIIACYPNVLQVSLDDMIETADAIVVGKVASILEPRWCESMIKGNKAICHDVIIEVDRYLYGQVESNRIAVLVYGGRIENTRMECDRMPEFITGEKVILILNRIPDVVTPYSSIDPADYYTIAGIYQGKYRLDNGNVIDWQSNSIKLSEIEQKIAGIHGKN